MGGGILQLAAYGENDIYLIGNPQITFFKTLYRRHTNFAIENIENVYSGQLDYGRTLNILIQRHGDLLGRILLEMETTAELPYSHNLYTLIDTVEIQIGGNRIDRHYGEWMFIWAQLNNSIEQYMQIDSMIYSQFNSNGGIYRYYAPLTFWFCNNPGLYLPLIGLSNHEVRLIVRFKSMPSGTANVLQKFRVFSDYYFLGEDEKRRFAQNQHEYLIEQVQYNNEYIVNEGLNVLDMNFKHPVKYLVFYVDLKQNSWNIINTYYQSTDGGGDLYNEIFDDFTIYINNQQLFYPRYGTFFRLYQQFEHFKGSTHCHQWVGSINSYALAKIYTYSFALKASEHQPSGTLNFSRITTPQFRFNIADMTTYSSTLNLFKCFAVNYNILKVESGLAGLVYT